MKKTPVFSSAVLLAATLLCLGTGWALGRVLGLLLALGVLLVLFLAVSVFFLFFCLRRGKGVLANVGPASGSRAQQDEKTRAFIAEKKALLKDIPCEDVYITSHDGLRLHGYYIPGAPGETRCVLLCHGYSVRALQMADYALYWRNTHGFNVLMPDARAHGESEGRYTGMGWLERRDCLQWFAFLQQRLGTEARFAMHGISMGGATVMNTGGEALPPQVKFLIEDCGFTSAWDEFAWQLRDRYRLPAFPILPVVSLLSRMVAGYGFKEAAALRQVPKITLPILFIHGEADTFVPTEMVYPLYEAAANSPQRELITVPGAAHVKAFWEDDAGHIKAAIVRYVESYLPPEQR